MTEEKRGREREGEGGGTWEERKKGKETTTVKKKKLIWVSSDKRIENLHEERERKRTIITAILNKKKFQD